MVDGQMVPHEFFSYIAVIASKVQEVDDAYSARQPEHELADKVSAADAAMRALVGMTPNHWWTITPERPLIDQVLQYWFFYFTVRNHLQLALRHISGKQYPYSYVTCYQAARAVSERYVQLRGALPIGFFAGRVLDLQAMTGAAALLFTTQRRDDKTDCKLSDGGVPSCSDLVRNVVQTMESVAGHLTGAFAKHAAPSLRALDDLLNKPMRADSKHLTLDIPMLGRINVRQHTEQVQVAYSQPRPQDPAVTASDSGMHWPVPAQELPAPDLTISGFTANDIPYSMDLMLEDDFIPFPEDPFGGDQWLSYDGSYGSNQFG